MTFRTERDPLGELDVPASAYYGIQTARAVENFPISGLHAPPDLVTATVLVKKAAAEANRDLVGQIKEVDGFKFCYKICRECGHAVRYFYPAVENNDAAVREYRAWKRYMAQ